MIHYSCDRCKRMIEPGESVRYTVHVEVEAVHPDHAQEPADDGDHLEQLHEALLRGEPALTDDHHCRHFDLCCGCYRQFMRNPLGVEPHLQLQFSKN